MVSGRKGQQRKLVAVVTLPFYFFLGMMLIDYGATMKINGGHAETLLFSALPGRIVYHSGILLAITAYLVASALLIHELTNETRYPWTHE